MIRASGRVLSAVKIGRPVWNTATVGKWRIPVAEFSTLASIRTKPIADAWFGDKIPRFGGVVTKLLTQRGNQDA